MIIPKLAFRNMLGAGAKTWLNAVVLSMAFVAIIWSQGLYIGIDAEVSRAMIEAECGGGQYWVEGYDPFDPFTIQDAHRPLTGPLRTLVEKGQATPFLIVQGTIYPGGRIVPVLLKGIDPGQKLLSIPSSVLKTADNELPALIGARMSATSGLKKGDTVTVRWRDAKGTFDAKDLQIVEVMRTTVQSIDSGQIWLPLQTLQEMAGMPSEATIVVTEKNYGPAVPIPGWTFKNLDYLLDDIKSVIQAKTIGSSILYSILLFLAMLAIFNTQLLSIWRRRKEIGTMMALGFSRGKVIRLFTLEGALNGVLAALVGAVYGIPLLAYTATHGLGLPADQIDSFGIAISEKLYPTYSGALVIGTTILVFSITTIVSFMPTRKIAKLKPTDALRGKLT
ncbi:MAG: FtsX-like permease family protein [Candidatus Aminicenantes bacterium]|nr:FtsX-like permease family protein [Candidatus Aminicenantes bacterium]